ncbi:MAG: response regulator [Desulfobacteraceae bacterium]|nr:response regulator [Desulfobacteraceae bacterium]
MKFDRVFDMGIRPFQTVVQGQEGFLWMGTGGGLARWDGYSLRIYGVGDGLKSATVSAIVQDAEDPDVFWLGTYGGGISRFDKGTEIFTNILVDPDTADGLCTDTIYHLLQDTVEPDILWVIGDVCFQKFNKKTGVFISYRHADDASIPENMRGWRLLQDRADGNILWLLAYRTGLYRIEKDTMSFTVYTHNPEDPQSLAIRDGMIASIVQDHDDPGILWLGSWNTAQLEKFDTRTGVFTHFAHDPSDPRGLPPLGVRFIRDDGRGKLWLAGWTFNNGLTVYDKKSGTFTNFTSVPGDPRSLSNDTIVYLYEDRSGIVWIMTYSGEVNKFDRNTQNFDLFRHNPMNPDSLVNNIVNHIYEDGAGRIWLSTGGGLSRYDPENGAFTSYNHDPTDPFSLDRDDIQVTFEDSAGNFWISGRSGKLMRFDRNTGRVLDRYETPRGVAAIVEDSLDPDMLWLGAWTVPFMRFDKQTGVFKHYPSDPDMTGRGPSKRNMFRVVHDAKDETIWMGSRLGGGLNRFDKTTDRFTYYRSNPDNPESLSHDSIAVIYQDASGILWIGTEGGNLEKFDKVTEIFTHYDKEYGIPYNVEGILEDDKGRLWLSTTDGILCFNPRTESVDKYYDRADGLSGDTFRDGSCGKTLSGDLWFGGPKGVTRFHPGRLVSNSYVPPVVLTTLTQGGDAINPDHSAMRIDEVILEWHHPYFEFEYAALNFTIPEKNRYQYKLDGWDDDWYDAGTERKGRYSGLPGGEYRLRVIGSNNDGQWNREGISLKVVVLPPFWRTWWAYGLYLLVGVSGLGGAIYARARIHARELAETLKALDRERLRIDELKQLDRLKDEFLANTSHELRTPLHGIIGLAESMVDGATGELPEETRYNLGLVISSGRRLSRLVNDILDYAKLRNKLISLNIEPIHLKSTVNMVLAMMEPLVRQKDLQLRNEVPGDLPLMAADGNRLQQILYNLMDNAVKFTPSGTVRIFAESAAGDPAGRLSVSVADTGTGIATDKLNLIFESFKQADGAIERVYGGAGLGLSITRELVKMHGGELSVASTGSQGTTFIFTIPVADKNTVDTAAEAMVSDSGTRELETPAIPNEVAEPDLDASGLTGNFSAEKGHILVVDDEPVNFQVLNNFLSRSNYRVTQCLNGADALMMVDNIRPDLIILDVMMPLMSGYEVCRKLRYKYSLSELPILMLTVKDRTKNMLNGFISGANDYLTKPFDKDELLARVDTLIRLKYTESEVRHLNKELERRVLDRTAQLAQANKELESFAYSVSHDLRAPLRHINGFVELLVNRENDRLESKSRHYLSVIRESTERMGLLIDDLLQLSRSGRVKMEKQPVRQNDLIESVRRELETDTKGRTISWNIAELPAVNGDPALLKQVWMNLLSNAVKYTNSRQEARIDIGTSADAGRMERGGGDKTIFYIRDNGVGFDPQYTHKLFGVFQRLHSEAEYEGTGIGLAIVKRIVQRHGGRVWAVGDSDRGATFYFTL